MYDPNDLGNQLSMLLDQINQQIDVVAAEAEKNGVRACDMRNVDGSWPMTPLLLAKSQTLKTIVKYESTRG